MNAEAAVQKLPDTPMLDLISDIILMPEFSELIDQTVTAYFQKFHPNVFRNPETIYAKPVKVDIDFSKLEQIRNEAAEIQEKLIVDSDESTSHGQPHSANDPDDKPPCDSVKQNREIAGTDFMQSCTDEWSAFIDCLSKVQIEALSVILSGQAVAEKLQSLSIRNNSLTEVVLEGINEVALECIGDNIIETGDVSVYIYDDYVENLYTALGC